MSEGRSGLRTAFFRLQNPARHLVQKLGELEPGLVPVIAMKAHSRW